ncbi:multifunctional oxoglutarate decarboxylase/oxoglutarate dehydrogenase thiamine pyrophosphate-binding subunit/dihydrolipoyllysine-residue succinyltransferase subunit [Babesia caballi]|uniref:Multifunctional oxoglutarate decarboxylase/oxoglutarate dehydrogenase thiamine pyrophosphate-binding subunit/dihydrolipoyllysine-residue succinyltransferase subunit n=1 Tax=Babesia caballi TaxID=5871 RepID=A0AAV4LNC3_BABCB|nr:multifunctional oxoglutarate decarboxylase/oxoglutarate dehydrogenase thiamine pyrophosphate-binding subunit/dihydrolipoyllysine-residue succinyltransferase subunit [Babesia caballi]
MLLTPLQHRNRKRYSRIAQPMRCHVGRRDAGADNLAIPPAENSVIISDESTKGPRKQSNGPSFKTVNFYILLNQLLSPLKPLLQPLELRTILMDSTARAFNLRNCALKKLFDGFGEGTSVVGPLPILARHPQDPVDGFLQV